MGVATLKLYLVDDAVNVPVEHFHGLPLEEASLDALTRPRQPEDQSAGLRVLGVRLRRELLPGECGLLLSDALLLLLNECLCLAVLLFLLLLLEIRFVLTLLLGLPLAFL